MMNLLDRAISYIAPKTGLRRKAQRMMEERLSAEWPISDTGGRIRGQNWFDRVRHVDAALSDHLETAQARSQDLYRSNVYAYGAVENRVSNEVCTGLTYRPTVRAVPGRITDRQAKRINESLELEVELLDRYGVDKSGKMSFGISQRLMVRMLANLGELFIEVGTRPMSRNRAPNPLSIDIQSPFRYGTPPEERANPRIRLGVEYDGNGEIVAYWRLKPDRDVSRVTSGRFGKSSDYERIPAFDERTGRPRILHVFEPMFDGQSRGLPWLVATAPRLKDFDDYWEATLVAQQIEACFSAFVKTSEDSSDPFTQAEKNSSGRDSQNRRLEDLEPGIIQYLNEGEDVVFGNPQRPGNNFEPFAQFFQRSIATGANIPYESFAKNWSRSSYSSGRLAVLDGRTGYLTRIDTLIKLGLAPIAREVVFLAAFSERLPGLRLDVYNEEPWLYERHQWQPPGYRQVDPHREQQGIDAGLESDSLTLIEVLDNRGDNLQDFMDRRQKAKEALIRQDIDLRRMQQELEQEAGLEAEEGQESEPAEEGAVS